MNSLRNQSHGDDRHPCAGRSATGLLVMLLLLAMGSGVLVWSLWGQTPSIPLPSNPEANKPTSSPPPPQLDPAQAPAMPSDPHSHAAEQASTTTSGHIHIQTNVSDFEPVDKRRFEDVNAVLEYEQLPPISPEAAINAADVAAFRDIVDRANRDIDAANQEWMMHVQACMEPRIKNLNEALFAGRTAGLPEEGPDNPAHEVTPHEVVSVTLYGGKRYVLRIGVDEVPELITLGQAIDSATRRRTADFNTRLRGLFRARR